VFFLVLKDLIKVFGMVESGTATGIAIFLSIVMANLGAFSGIIYGLMGIFAFLAGLSVIGVLVAIIGFAVASHFGLMNFAERMMKRRAMLEASKIEAKGTELAATVGGFLDVAKKMKEEE